jgi:hypothetical protein
MSEDIEKSADVPPVEHEKLEEEKFDALGANDAGVIPKGSLDPVYEAKARVLNHAVRRRRFVGGTDIIRFKKSAWDGTK